MAHDGARDLLADDRALLARFRTGERAALATVFRHYAEEVARGISVGVVVDVEGRPTRVGARLPAADLEALVQETFVRAFSENARLAYDGVRPYAAYLITIARNLLIDRARREKVRSRVVLVADLEESICDSSAIDPTWGLEERELQTLLSEVRDALKEPERSVYRLRFEEGLSLRDVAEALGLGTTPVRRVDARLRQELLTRLRKAGYLQDADITIPNPPGVRKGP